MHMPGDMNIEQGMTQDGLESIDREHRWLLEMIKDENDHQVIGQYIERESVLERDLVEANSVVSAQQIETRFPDCSTYKTAHGTDNFFGKYSETAMKNFSEVSEADILRICRFLKCSDKVPQIAFKLFPTIQDKQAADPLSSPGRASARYDEATVYRVWGKDLLQVSFPHESTHLVAHSLFTPYKLKSVVDTASGGTEEIETNMVGTVFFQEGLAIALNELEFGVKYTSSTKEEKFIDDWLKQGIKSDGWRFSLQEMLNMDGFDKYGSPIGPVVAGSFCKFLINQYGINAFLSIYGQSSEVLGASQNISLIEKVFGTDFESLSRDWISSLNK
jgi:hypothetical protein